jgi:uncharacterized protein YcbK (DUF882 family)
MNQRRSFLKTSAVLASAMGVPAIAKSAVAAPGERTLRLFNTHTGETTRSVFWAEGKFIPEGLAELNKLLRDHRNDTVTNMDPQLMMLLERVSSQFGSNKILHVISGYRSPESNQKLAAASNGVAKHSMHMEGKAIDVRLPGLQLADLHKAALAAKGGGVGYYPDSQFVHLDTGRLRHW